MRRVSESEDRLRRLESEIERRLLERFAGLRDEFERLRLESDRRWEGFLSRFDQDFTGLVPPELVALPEPPPAPEPSELPDRPAGGGLLSIEIARNLDDAGNQVEALHRFLELCRRHASRAALLISKSGSLVVWKATGFGEHGGSDEAARRVLLPMDGGPLSRVIEGSSFRLPAGNDVSARLGASDASSAVLVPIVVKEKVSGAVYADCTAEDEKRFDPESIAFLTFLAGLFVDRLAGRKLKPAPALRGLEVFEGARAGGSPKSEETSAAPSPAAPPQAAEEKPATEEKPAARETPAESSRPGPRESFGTQVLRFGAAPPAASAPMAPHPAPADEPARPEPEFAEPEAEHAPSPASGTEAEPGAHVGAEAGVEPSLAYEPDDEPAPPERTASRGEIPDAPPPSPSPEAAPPPAPAPPAPQASSAFQPPSGGRRLAGPLAPADGDERREEARRFAKLLVSEIKLYNEKAVLEGRQHGDLYPRLREDIDRSRQMYDERIPEDVRSNSNFFYEELVRILAEGRAESLGL